MDTVKITTPFIKLDDLLKFSALCPSGGNAKFAIQCGLVFVNGEKCEMRGKKIYPGDVVQFNSDKIIVEHAGK